jgi:hypothetical protein
MPHGCTLIRAAGTRRLNPLSWTAMSLSGSATFMRVNRCFVLAYTQLWRLDACLCCAAKNWLQQSARRCWPLSKPVVAVCVTMSARKGVLEISRKTISSMVDPVTPAWSAQRQSRSRAKGSGRHSFARCASAGESGTAPVFRRLCIRYSPHKRWFSLTHRENIPRIPAYRNAEPGWPRYVAGRPNLEDPHGGKRMVEASSARQFCSIIPRRHGSTLGNNSGEEIQYD